MIFERIELNGYFIIYKYDNSMYSFLVVLF